MDVEALETPVYVVDTAALRSNLKTLSDVQERAGCTILLALKGFAMWPVFDLVAEYLPGVTASSVHEARLGAQAFSRPEAPRQVHACAPAYSARDFAKLLEFCDHIVFNTPTQARMLLPLYKEHRANGGPPVQFGLRVNHEHSEVDVAIYDPCAPGSRLGTRADQLSQDALVGLTGLHFHSLCELGADALARTLAVFEEKFAAFLPQVQWVNMGGGHHITKPGYDLDGLVALICAFRERHDVEVYLEPGEAIALNTGVLVTSVLDIIENDAAHGPNIALLDTSAAAHMPDVLEMPYRPEIVGAGPAGLRRHTYRLGGATCLAGDIIGDYSFDQKLHIDDKLVFLDMAHYTMVKNTTFNGVKLPSIATADPISGIIQVVRRFGYEDYKGRLG